MNKLNCWEFKNCGRQPGGDKVHELGHCRAAVETSLHGTNSGINGGRACWSLEGTLCGNEKQGSYAQKLQKCLQCDFFAMVRQEEERNFQNSRQILMKYGLAKAAEL